jgi:sugar lactone lactonase YvrE
MEKGRSRLTSRWWMLMPIALFALALQSVGTIAAAQTAEHWGGPWCRAGEFPAFTPMPAGITPRGVAVDRVGNVYVSVGQILVADNKEHILIWRFRPWGGRPSFVADVGQGTIGGLMVTAKGDLYVALAAGVDRGVWRVDGEGNKQLLPGSNQIFFANGLAFDHRGTLYVTESVTTARIEGGKPAGPGGIWRILRGGEAELWMRDELLTGTGALGQPVWIGANGIAYYHGNLYVTNTEKGTLLQIPVQEDGSPGVPEVRDLQEVEESPLAGIPGFPPPMGDGLVVDAHGNLYVAVLTRSAVVRIDAEDLSQETVAVFMAKWPVGAPPDAPLDFPASLFFGTGRGERTSLFVTNLGMGAKLVPQLPVIGTVPWAGPGLVKIDAGVPGRPIH